MTTARPPPRMMAALGSAPPGLTPDPPRWSPWRGRWDAQRHHAARPRAGLDQRALPRSNPRRTPASTPYHPRSGKVMRRRRLAVLPGQREFGVLVAAIGATALGSSRGSAATHVTAVLSINKTCGMSEVDRPSVVDTTPSGTDGPFPFVRSAPADLGTRARRTELTDILCCGMNYRAIAEGVHLAARQLSANGTEPR
jgi:hypothetical protein